MQNRPGGPLTSYFFENSSYPSIFTLIGTMTSFNIWFYLHRMSPNITSIMCFHLISESEYLRVRNRHSPAHSFSKYRLYSPLRDSVLDITEGSVPNTPVIDKDCGRIVVFLVLSSSPTQESSPRVRFVSLLHRRPFPVVWFFLFSTESLLRCCSSLLREALCFRGSFRVRICSHYCAFCELKAMAKEGAMDLVTGIGGSLDRKEVLNSAQE